MSHIPGPVPPNRAIFLEAVKIADEQERGEFLDQACGGDTERRRKLERLLVASETAAANSLDQAVEHLVPHETHGEDGFVQARSGQDREPLDRLRAMLSVRNEADALSEGQSESQSAPRDDDSPELPGLGRVGRFRLERLVGRGGMGNVFLGYDEQLHRPAALKFPRVDIVDDAQQLERFLREARLAAQLNHPNLVEIYEVGVWGQACFIASQWCEGGDLSDWLRKHPGPHDPAWSALLVGSVARAAAYCHQQGVVHLDIKPANVVLVADADSSGGGLPFKPMLTDFGIARMFEEGLTCTHSSLLLGTPLYMAPEQAECRRDKIGPASDVFALGVVLYELLFGRRPFEGDSAIEVLDQLRSPDTLVLPATGKVPRELRTVCQRCLEHDPASRYPSADALAEDLDRYLRGEPVHARPVSRRQLLWRWCERPERIVQAGV
ncbi:MAG: serine/threonine-protein kinase, partial [Candidatus Paceibacterota bacterium]